MIYYYPVGTYLTKIFLSMATTMSKKAPDPAGSVIKWSQGFVISG